jgi:hypothetical protein
VLHAVRHRPGRPRVEEPRQAKPPPLTGECVGAAGQRSTSCFHRSKNQEAPLHVLVVVS